MPPSSAQEVETYLTKHDLSDILSKALNACVQAQPDAPLPFLIDELKGSNAAAARRSRARPSRWRNTSQSTS